ncbi:hypothetical protein TCAL_15023 [Tigriopus californicus]|uniref:Uncharacterized protein n=1 Tax=Tigriopus californicus TaxID=6832 RepID=A0A553NZL7_TIGCA|nr:hypothetical protein TCAL_15023 [Tigriopus californicus]
MKAIIMDYDDKTDGQDAETEMIDHLETSPILKTKSVHGNGTLAIPTAKANLWPNTAPCHGPEGQNQIVGFRSGSGKPVLLSKEALDRAKQMWEETVSDDPPIMKTQQSVKPIPLSKDALQKAQALWMAVANPEESEMASSHGANNNAEGTRIETGLKRTRDEGPEEEVRPQTPTFNPLPKLNPSRSENSHTPVTSRLRQLGVRRSSAFSTPTLKSRVFADASKGDTSASPICRPNLAKRPRLPFKAPRVSLDDVPQVNLQPSIHPDMADSPDFEELANQIMNELETAPLETKPTPAT